MSIAAVQLGLTDLLEHIRRKTGLVFTGSRRSGAETSLLRIMRSCGITDPQQFSDFLESDPQAFDAVAAALTVGETYFFRDPAQFNVIRNVIIPDIRSRKPPGLPLWCWSAGCATGEEPYSLAILAEEEGIGSQVRILGTDLSRAALAGARAGIYGAWSFRNEPAELRKVYFSQEGKHYILHEWLRQRVRFAFHNLVSADFPSPLTGTAELDLILCRNVLIYLAVDDAARIARRLYDCLSYGGWLLTGASDPRLDRYAPFRPVLTESGLVYRRDTREEAQRSWHPLSRGIDRHLDSHRQKHNLAGLPDATHRLARHLAEWQPTQRRKDEGPFQENRKTELQQIDGALPGMSSDTSAHAGEVLMCARHLFNRGEYDAVVRLTEATSGNSETRGLHIKALMNLGRNGEALEKATDACAAYPFDPSCHYLKAVLLIAEGRQDGAIEALRRVIYLDRSLAAAHLALASLYRQKDNLTAARRAYEQAYRLCVERPSNEPVPLTEGETASQLAQWARRAALECEEAERGMD